MSKAELVLHTQLSEQHSQHSEKSKSEEDEQQIQEINAPRIDRNLSYDPDFSHIIISTAFTHYPVVRQVALSLGMSVIEDRQNEDWDICWTDYSVTPQTFIRMHFHQTISYVPGIHSIARKNQLGKSLNAMKNELPMEYNFHPTTWMLPQDFPILRKHLQLNKQKQTYIVKPQAECQGKGIYLVNKIQDIEIGKYCVVQKYISNPLLIEGYKFDLRLYVLIGSIDPLRIYLYDDGLGRFATEIYQTPNKANYKSTYQHLTNYAINKLNPKFKASLSGGDNEGGFKRSLKAVMRLLFDLGVDTEQLWKRIKQISIKTILTSYQLIRHYYLSCQPEQYHNRMAFHILGLDILIDDRLEPILLQVNHTPSFATETALDKRIKFNLVRDTLILMQCNNLKLKQELFNKSKTYIYNRMEQGKRQTYNEQMRKNEVSNNLQARQRYQANYLGGYELIFPLNDEIGNMRFANITDRVKNILYSNLRAKQHIQKQKQKGKQKECRMNSKLSIIEKQSLSFKLYLSNNTSQPDLQVDKPQNQHSKRMDYTINKEQLKNKQFNSAELKKNNRASKFTKQLKKDNFYHQKSKQDTQVANTLTSFNKKELSSHELTLHPLLYNITTRNSRAFTIKTKHNSITHVTIRNILKLQEQPKRQAEIKNNNTFQNKQGSFLKPKSYDVPSLIFIEVPKVKHRKKELRTHLRP